MMEPPEDHQVALINDISTLVGERVAAFDARLLKELERRFGSRLPPEDKDRLLAVAVASTHLGGGISLLQASIGTRGTWLTLDARLQLLEQELREAETVPPGVVPS